MTEGDEKAILSRYKSEDFLGCNYTVNFYHRASFLRGNGQELVGFSFGGEAHKRLEFDLSEASPRGNILVGLENDPYVRIETMDYLMRGSLELFLKYGFGISIVTRSDLVLRDLQVLKRLQRKSPVSVHFPLISSNDDIGRKMEYNKPLSSSRLMAMEELASHGLMTGIIMSPMLPGVNDDEDDIRDFVKQVYVAGGRWIISYSDYVVKAGKDEFYKQIDRFFPGLKEKYIRKYKGRVWSPFMSKSLWNTFTRECERYDILYEYDEIIEYILNNYRIEQTSMFM